MFDASENATFEPAETFTISNLETVKAISDPLRIRILESLYKEPGTVKQVATELGIPPTKLYYHVNVLEEHGLIRAVSSRVVSGIIEKTYRIAARNIVVDKGLFRLPPAEMGDSVETLLSAIFDNARKEIRTGIETQHLESSSDATPLRRLMLGRTLNRLRAADASVFFAKLTALMDEFNLRDVDADDPDSALYSLVVALYPVPPATMEGVANE